MKILKDKLIISIFLVLLSLIYISVTRGNWTTNIEQKNSNSETKNKIKLNEFLSIESEHFGSKDLKIIGSNTYLISKKCFEIDSLSISILAIENGNKITLNNSKSKITDINNIEFDSYGNVTEASYFKNWKIEVCPYNGIEISSDDKSRYNYYPLTTFQGFQVSYKINNNTFFEITGMAGAIWFKDDIKGCLKRKEKIKSTIKDSLGTSVINIDDQNIKRKHWADKSGKSFTYDTTYYLKNEDHISLDCFDWSKETDSWDHLRLTVSTSEHNDLVNNDYNK